MPRCSEGGTWTVKVAISDIARRNTTIISTLQLAMRGLRSSITVQALDAHDPYGAVPSTIPAGGVVPVTFNEPTLWKDGTSATALTVTDATAGASIAGTWACTDSVGTVVTCDAEDADVTVARFQPTSPLPADHLCDIDVTPSTIFDTSGNPLPAFHWQFTTS